MTLLAVAIAVVWTVGCCWRATRAQPTVAPVEAAAQRTVVFDGADVEKAVELGVATIQPLQTQRGIVRLDRARALKRCAHWRAIAIAACEQCGRNRIPDVLPVMALREWLGQPAAEHGDVRIVLAPDAGLALKTLPRPRTGATLIAGPEGGLTAEELRDAERAGFVAVRLGPRILRTETAALAALAAMQVLWGDF